MIGNGVGRQNDHGVAVTIGGVIAGHAACGGDDPTAVSHIYVEIPNPIVGGCHGPFLDLRVSDVLKVAQYGTGLFFGQIQVRAPLERKPFGVPNIGDGAVDFVDGLSKSGPVTTTSAVLSQVPRSCGCVICCVLGVDFVLFSGTCPLDLA